MPLITEIIHNDSAEKPAEASPEVEVITEEKQEEAEATPWQLILFDDDIHTFDEVINQLIKALKCSLPEAEEITYKVHNEGKALVYEGPFEECLRINGVLQEIQLVTEIKG